jgi:hypothetical protein
VLVADYGLSRALPTPLPTLTRPSKRGKGDSEAGAR